MSYDKACAYFDCGRRAEIYWLIYDHRDCGMIRGVFVLAPACREHLDRVVEKYVRAHLQCMGQAASPEAIEAVFNSAAFDLEVNHA